jgi:hypothetical protein
MAEKSNTELTMKIDDKMLSLEQVSEAQKHFAIILHEIDRAMSSKSQRMIRWILSDAKSGSFTITVDGFPSTENIGVDYVLNTISALKDGLKLLSTGGVRPSQFSDPLLRSLKALAYISRDGLPVRIYNKKVGEASISREIALNVDKIIGITLKSYGSVEGELKAITLVNKPEFKIISLLDNEAVECSFSLDDLEIAKEALNKRVCVYGLILSKENGKKIRINVDEIEIFPSEDELPRISDFAGMWSNQE